MPLFMENLLSRADQKLIMNMKHAYTGLAEIDKSGKINSLNLKGETLLKPILVANNIAANNLFPILDYIASSIVDKIKNSSDEAGNIVTNELHSFTLSFGEENVERHFNFTVIKIFTDCIIV